MLENHPIVPSKGQIPHTLALGDIASNSTRQEGMGSGLSTSSKLQQQSEVVLSAHADVFAF
jgi:hypothetical protein